ncbi:MAG: LCP family protein [Anaerolineales bacterium]
MIKKRKLPIPDWLAETQPSQSAQLEVEYDPLPPRRRRKGWRTFALLVIILAVYLFFPTQDTILVLGIDRAFENTAIGRSDTNILLSVRPLPGTISILSIPRDLWVTIPNYGENRINTAHYFGEGEQTGNGPRLAVTTVEENFDLRVDRYVRIQLEKFSLVVDAMGGVELQLDTAMAGYPAGTHLLNGTQALAFVRDRAGTDDFFRMAQGQVFLSSFLRTLLKPATWLKAPNIFIAMVETIDTDIPLWQMPRLIVTAVRSFLFEKIEFIILQREMVNPWVTPAGDMVLLPDWPKIQPVIQAEFGR